MFGGKRLNAEDNKNLKATVENYWFEGLNTFLESAKKTDLKNAVLKMVPGFGSVMLLSFKLGNFLPNNLIVNSLVYGLCAAGLAITAKVVYDVKHECSTPTNQYFAEKAFNTSCEKLYEDSSKRFIKEKNSFILPADDNSENMEYGMYV